MYLRKCRKTVRGRAYVYWQLVESCRTERGPRQRVVAYLSDLDEPDRLGVTNAARGASGAHQGDLLSEEVAPTWVEVDPTGVRVERVRDFGQYWLGLHLIETLGLVAFLETVVDRGREEVPWSAMALVLILLRLVDPASELRIAEHLFERSALSDLLGIPVAKVNDDRLYRTLDQLLPHKAALEKHLTERLGQLFDLDYDLLLYDITSTYFEGASADNPAARFGYSRDKRSDCKQVLIALVVSREGMPLGYEQFTGNRADSSTVVEIVEKVERQYGKAERIWVMDRGMISQKTLPFLQAEGRQYIVGTPRSQLRQFAQELADDTGWETIQDGLSVKLIPSAETAESLILCRSEARGDKERAMHARFATRIATGLDKLVAACGRVRKVLPATAERRIGALLTQNSRARRLFQVTVGTRPDGGATVAWEKREDARAWAALKDGCYVLRTNVVGNVADLWRSYIQLTEVEAAFRIQKTDLRIRPIWHQTEDRVAAHILVCFLAYVLWKTLGQLCQAAGLGHEPRKVIDELGAIKLVDVVLPTKSGVDLRRRCIAHPTPAQAILLDRLKLRLPTAVASCNV
jgi:Transposase DDE domain